MFTVATYRTGPGTTQDVVDPLATHAAASLRLILAAATAGRAR